MIVRSSSVRTSKMLKNEKQQPNKEKALPRVSHQLRHSNRRNRLRPCKMLMWLQAPERTRLVHQSKWKTAGGSLEDLQACQWIKTRRIKFSRNGEDSNPQYLSPPKASRETKVKVCRKKVESQPMFHMLIWMQRLLRIPLWNR